MADFPILFTGKDVSYEPRTTGQLKEAGKRFDERLIQGEQYKREDRLRDEKFFFETADVDPVQLMSDKLTQVQEQTLNDFNDKWAGVYAEQGGTLTSPQKSEMFRDRKAMEAKQAQWEAAQQRFELDTEMIKRDSQRITPILDQEHYKEKAEGYYQTGQYEGGLQYTPVNPGVYFTKNRLPGSGDRTMTSDIIDGRTITTETRTPGTKEESDRFIESHIKQDMAGGRGRLVMGIVQEFQSRPDEEKAQYLMGTQIVGEVDTPEETNAIIRWAQDYYEKDVRRVAETQKDLERPPRARSTSTKPPANELVDGVIYDRIGNEIMRLSDGVSPSIITPGPGYELTDKVRTMNVGADKLFASNGRSFADEFGGVPKTKIRVRPDVMTSDQVEFLLVSPVKVEREVLLDDMTRESRKKATVRDGKYYVTETIPADTPVGAYINEVKTNLANTLGGDALKNAIEGLDPYDKYKE